jgi:hypothetical protein
MLPQFNYNLFTGEEYAPAAADHKPPLTFTNRIRSFAKPASNSNTKTLDFFQVKSHFMPLMPQFRARNAPMCGRNSGKMPALRQLPRLKLWRFFMPRHCPCLASFGPYFTWMQRN